MEATGHENGILLRPETVVDRDLVAGQRERVPGEAPVAPEDRSRSEESIRKDAKPAGTGFNG